MNNIQIQVRYVCPACQGTGLQKNPDHNPADIFPEQMHDICHHCDGKRVVTQWIALPVLLQSIAELDIQV